MAESHMCVGPTCWTCGEPTELRYMRTLIWEALQGKTANDPYRISKIAAGAIREEVLGMVTKIVELQNELEQAKRAPITRVEIDPNVRVRGNQTMTGLENVYGPVAVGQAVEVFESEAGIVGDAWVSDIDNGKGLVYLKVRWSSLRGKEGNRGVSVE